MITAEINNKYYGGIYRVDRLINRGEWFGKTWFIGIGCGFDIHRIVVEADNEQDAIDTLTDSKYGHLIKTDELCHACDIDDVDNCTCEFAGNYGERVNLDEIRILQRCKVNYFAPKSLDYK